MNQISRRDFLKVMTALTSATVAPEFPQSNAEPLVQKNFLKQIADSHGVKPIKPDDSDFYLMVDGERVDDLISMKFEPHNGSIYASIPFEEHSPLATFIHVNLGLELICEGKCVSGKVFMTQHEMTSPVDDLMLINCTFVASGPFTERPL